MNPMIQQYANAFQTQMDAETNKAKQNGLLTLQSYQPAPAQTQSTSTITPQFLLNSMRGAK